MIGKQLKHVSLALGCAAGLGLAGVAQGNVIDLTPGSSTVAQWTFANDLSATHLGSNVSGASDFSNTIANPQNDGHSGGPAISVDGAEYGSGQPINDGGGGPGGRVFARFFEDVTSDAYQFSVTIDTGFVLNLQDVVFDAGHRTGGLDELRVAVATQSDFSDEIFIGGGGAGMGNRDSDLDAGYRTDVNDTAMGYGEDGNFNVLRPTSSNFSWNRYVNGDLEGAEGQGLTGEVFFRVYAGGGKVENNSDDTFYLDNVTIRGEVSTASNVNPIPSPTAGLAGLGLMGLLGLKRRRGAAGGR